MSSTNSLRAAILIISDTASADASTDRAGPAIQDVFQDVGGNQWNVVETKIVPDNIPEIQRCVTRWSDHDESRMSLVVTSGGTGFAVKDQTPEVSRLSWYFGL
jgi:gephyrin